MLFYKLGFPLFNFHLLTPLSCVPVPDIFETLVHIRLLSDYSLFH